MSFHKNTLKRFLPSSSLDSNYIAKLSDSDNLLLQFSCQNKRNFSFTITGYSAIRKYFSSFSVEGGTVLLLLLLRQNITFSHLGSQWSHPPVEDQVRWAGQGVWVWSCFITKFQWRAHHPVARPEGEGYQNNFGQF